MQMQINETKPGYQLVQLCKLSQSQKTQIPNDWEVRLLKEILKINPEQIDNNYTQNEILYIDIGSVENYEIHKYERFYIDERPSRAQRIVRKNDIIVSTVRPYLKGFAKIQDSKPNLICSTGFAVLRPKNSADTDFIFNYIKSHFFEVNIIRQMEGMAYPAITSNIVGNSLIPYCKNENERIKIGSLLSDVANLIQKTDQVIEQTQRLKKGLMQKLLTKGIGHTKFKDITLRLNFLKLSIPESWTVTNLEQITNIIDTPHYTSPYFESGIAVIRTTDCDPSGEIDYSNTKFTSEIEYEKRREIIDPEVGDILYTREAPPGVAVIVNRKKISVGQRIVLLKPKLDIIKGEYLVLFLNSRLGILQSNAMILKTTVDHVNIEDIRKFKIAIPTIQEQNVLLNIFGNLNNRISNLKYYNYYLLNVKKGLMQKLLTGKIRVKQ
jgi:type I restriction enzyme S subunit